MFQGRPRKREPHHFSTVPLHILRRIFIHIKMWNSETQHRTQGLHNFSSPIFRL